MEAAISVIDDYIEELFNATETLVRRTRDSLERKRKKKNKETLQYSAGVTIGGFMRTVGGMVVRKEFPDGYKLRYYGAMVRRARSGARIALGIKLSPISCGIEDYEKVVQEYDILKGLPETYETYLPPLPEYDRMHTYGRPKAEHDGTDGEGKYYRHHPLAKVPAEIFPEPMMITVDIFKIELYDALGCLLSSSTLRRSIDDLVEALRLRLQTTSRLFDIYLDEYGPLNPSSQAKYHS